MAVAITKKVEEGEEEADPDAVNTHIYIYIYKRIMCAYADIKICMYICVYIHAYMPVSIIKGFLCDVSAFIYSCICM
jgi:hypothetical protein